MPTLPEDEPGPPSRVERFGDTVRRVGAGIGIDARVHARVLVFLLLAGVAVSMAPVPWAQIGVLALVGLALDWTRKTQGLR